ncbi:hypothetical protein [Bacillus toyonensis]|uniref:hypothetical protein n=1 Tax=Bacillus toyonensis TaxID=155322 RepID=UPI0015CF812F|nr:hypothetical protein [Bacillus toyonensis]
MYEELYEVAGNIEKEMQDLVQYHSSVPTFSRTAHCAPELDDIFSPNLKSKC